MSTPLGLLGSAATAVVLLVLLAGCAAHLTRPAAFPGALRAHAVLPGRAVGPAAAVVTVAECLLVAAGTAALLGRHRSGLTAVLAAAAALFACYALYTRHALATGRGGPCGCSRAEVPLSGWVTGRAWTFAALALLGLLVSAGPGTPPEGAAETAVVALVALTFATLLWMLPAAMTQPGAGTRSLPYGTPQPPERGRRSTPPARALRPVHLPDPVVPPRPGTAPVAGGRQPWTS
ncbi:MauE/DoxX family redox-associated membrane protein [Streptomyces sp. PLM4]|uniref:MauE/DoxX family redox-associated membrane protein n=1 Tax=Streptomyces sp. PLM4 TaxID=2929798 RepID=UPI00206ED42A|nr:MauE/DoxX family redox-associated membrane protein [Streptomyces sp. PLM4]BDH68368.1 hypothetical protein MTP06_18170 [Streptomyces sp. PLM4]